VDFTASVGISRRCVLRTVNASACGQRAHSQGDRRPFYGTCRGDEVRVGIAGHQNADGTVSGRFIVLEVADDVVDPAGARELTRHLIAAADEIDRLAEAQR
jgi:hypothetical protein